jgi:hypothetical protein
MKQKEIQRVKVYYERIQKLGHSLQILTTCRFLTIVFRVGLQAYFSIVTTGMKRSTLQHHKEATMLCEESMTITKAKSSLSIP